MTIYGQQEAVKDMVAARLATGRPIFFEVSDTAVHDLTSDRPSITFTHEGRPQRIECDFIAGCDGFHGISRPSIPESAIRIYDRTYPFGWLGIPSQSLPGIRGV